jgi:hypothetical protein
MKPIKLMKGKGSSYPECKYYEVLLNYIDKKLTYIGQECTVAKIM